MFFRLYSFIMFLYFLMFFVPCNTNKPSICLSKFKVSLAAQTLSNSVAVALRTLQDMGYAEFRDSEATSEFIQVMQLGIYIIDLILEHPPVLCS